MIFTTANQKKYKNNPRTGPPTILDVIFPEIETLSTLPQAYYSHLLLHVYQFSLVSSLIGLSNKYLGQRKAGMYFPADPATIIVCLSLFYVINVTEMSGSRHTQLCWNVRT